MKNKMKLVRKLVKPVYTESWLWDLNKLSHLNFKELVNLLEARRDLQQINVGYLSSKQLKHKFTKDGN